MAGPFFVSQHRKVIIDPMANDVIGIGFIGTGFARTVQMPAFGRIDGARLVSVASGDPANAAAAAEEFDLGHHTGDWRETVAHPEVDLVCITTPPVFHHQMALAAAEAGKHILCEKPMAMNLAEAREMADAVRGNGRLALIDHELRSQPGRRLARKMLADGAIGKIRHAKATFQAPHRGSAELPWNWWSDAASGGGALGAINSHIIDSLHWLLGTNIKTVACQLQSHVKERRDASGETRSVTTDDEANLLLRFVPTEDAPDATGLVSVSMVEYPKYRNRIDIYGTEGAIRIEHRGELFIAKAGEKDWTEVGVSVGEHFDGPADTGFSRAFNLFAAEIIEALQHGETEMPDAATFDDGVAIQAVLDAARRSDRSGAVEAV